MQDTTANLVPHYTTSTTLLYQVTSASKSWSSPKHFMIHETDSGILLARRLAYIVARGEVTVRESQIPDWASTPAECSTLYRNDFAGLCIIFRS